MTIVYEQASPGAMLIRVGSEASFRMSTVVGESKVGFRATRFFAQLQADAISGSSFSYANSGNNDRRTWDASLGRTLSGSGTFDGSKKARER